MKHFQDFLKAKEYGKTLHKDEKELVFVEGLGAILLLGSEDVYEDIIHEHLNALFSSFRREFHKEFPHFDQYEKDLRRQLTVTFLTEVERQSDIKFIVPVESKQERNR